MLFKTIIYLNLIFICLFINSCTTTPLPSGGQVTIPEDFFGIVHASRTGKEQEKELLDEMGCVWVLYTFFWKNIEPEKDVFDFTQYDNYVSGSKRQGRKIIGVLGYTPSYFYDGGIKDYISKENMPFYLRYIEKTISRYKGQVDVWCIWNEPNIASWDGKDSEFYELTKLTTIKIRETDPDAYIIGGAFWRSPTNFIKKMYKAGGFNGLDGIAFHPYGANPSDCMNVIDKFTKTLSEINYSGPVWITETGYPTGGWYPTKVNQKKYPVFIAKTLTGAAARGARALLWYEIFDRVDAENPSLDSEKHFGLLNKDLSRKPGSWAYELCARYLPGSRYVPELPKRENVPASIVSFCFLGGVSGSNTLILWNDKRNTQKIEVNLPATALVHDISTGKNSPFPVNSTVSITNKPLIITWHGTDVPRIKKANKK